VSTRVGLWAGGGALVLALAAGSTLAMAGLGGGLRLPGSRGGCGIPVLDGAVVDVTLTDMGPMSAGRGGGPGLMMGEPWASMRVLASPASVQSGTVSLRVVNAGMLRHELLVLPLPLGQAVGTRTVGADGQVDETAALGEASRDCAPGAGDGIHAGAAGWVTLRLAAGRYELVCNRVGHYGAGMFTELDVTAAGRT